MIMRLLLILLFTSLLNAQTIVWQDVSSSYTLPKGVKIVKGVRTSPALNVWYIDVDLNEPTVAVRPYVSAASMTLPSFTASVGAYAAVNGGYFGGGIPYSSVVYPNEVKAVNVQSVTRNSQTYPVVRSFFGMKKDRSLSVDWVYHFGNALTDLYTFAQPLPYVANDPTPRPAPSKSAGSQYTDLLVGIGGGPMLIKNDTVKITYNQELMWGSGVGETNSDPRTAVGFTANKHVIMLVADGRQAASDGVGLPELASILKQLGCIGAVNLDGGGSTQMAVPGKLINIPSESRPVPAILAVVHTDSLNLPKEPLFQKVIDTGDTNATALGGGWFESANPGYWAATKAMLHAIGNGTGKFEFRPHLPARAVYSVYGWWVSSSNRATDTPFIISHRNGTDTVRVDQVANGSSWRLLGTYEFSGNAEDRITLSDAAKTGNYVVADAVRLTSVDPAVLTAVRTAYNDRVPRSATMLRSFPNPFNPSTMLRYTVSEPGRITLQVSDLLGRVVRTVVDEWCAEGEFEVQFDAAGLSSGVYVARLVTPSASAAARLLLMQ